MFSPHCLNYMEFVPMQRQDFELAVYIGVLAVENTDGCDDKGSAHGQKPQDHTSLVAETHDACFPKRTSRNKVSNTNWKLL